MESLQKALARCAAGRAGSNSCRLRDNFCELLKSVWETDPLLVDKEEADFRRRYERLSFEAQVLLVRLFMRKGPWFRVQQLAYAEIPRPPQAVLELAEAGMLQQWTPDAADDADALAGLAVVPELQALHDKLYAQRFVPLRRRKLCRADLLAAIKSMAGARELPALLHELLGPLVRVGAATSTIVARLLRVHFLREGQSLGHIQAVGCGSLRYPPYTVHRQRPAWFKRSQLLQYEAALAQAARLTDALESGDDAAAAAELASVWAAMDQQEHKCMPSPLKQTTQGECSLVFLSRFQAGWVHCLMGTAGVSLLEKTKRFDQAVERLQQLLGSPYCLGRRGDWWLRLSINLEHLGKTESSLEIAETALADEWLSPGQRLALQRRVLRLGKPPRRWKKPPWAARALREVPERRAVYRPLQNALGIRCQYMGLDGQVCTVEELALQVCGTCCVWMCGGQICGCRSIQESDSNSEALQSCQDRDYFQMIE